MPPAWYDKIRAMMPKRTSPSGSVTEIDIDPGIGDSGVLPQANPDRMQQWSRATLEGLPTGMFILGLLLTICSQLIGLWAMLGYLLLVMAPIVYWLGRIEKRLAELIETNKRR